MKWCDNYCFACSFYDAVWGFYDDFCFRDDVCYYFYVCWFYGAAAFYDFVVLVMVFVGFYDDVCYLYEVSCLTAAVSVWYFPDLFVSGEKGRWQNERFLFVIVVKCYWRMCSCADAELGRYTESRAANQHNSLSQSECHKITTWTNHNITK